MTGCDEKTSELDKTLFWDLRGDKVRILPLQTRRPGWLVGPSAAVNSLHLQYNVIQQFQVHAYLGSSHIRSRHQHKGNKPLMVAL